MIIEYLFYVLFFFTPLVFFPNTSEVFEFNKMVFVYILTVLIISSWVIKMISRKKIIFKKTMLDIPLLLFLGSQIISTVISIDQRTSFLGYYSRFNGGLMSTACYSLLYWAFVSNLTKRNIKYILYSILTSACLIAIYGIFEHFGHSVSCIFVSSKFDDDCWVQDVRARVFATLGQPNWLSAYLVAILPLSLIFTLNSKFETSNLKSVFKIKNLVKFVVPVLLFACILFTGSRSGLLALFVAMIIFGIFNFRKNFKKLVLLGSVFTALILIFGTSITPSINQLMEHKKVTQTTVDTGEGGTESGAIRKIVWQGALNIWKAYPIFGTGVETFGYSYWQFRPVAHNNTSEWNYLYNKAHNEYLNFLANTGIVGLTAYLIFIGICIIVILDKKNPFNFAKNDRIRIALLTGFVSILITNFFGFSVVIISLFTFLFPAIAVLVNQEDGTYKVNKVFDNNQKLFIGGVLFATLFVLIVIGRYYLADIFYQKAQNELSTGLFSSSFKDIQMAIDYSPNEAIYHNELARILTEIAVSLSQDKKSSEASQIAMLAIKESDTAFNLSPRNMNVRETAISVYLGLSIFDSSYNQTAINLIKETQILSPTDPKLPLLLAKTYANEGKISVAINEVNEALKLKPDYADAKSVLQILTKLQNKH